MAFFAAALAWFLLVLPAGAQEGASAPAQPAQPAAAAPSTATAPSSSSATYVDLSTAAMIGAGAAGGKPKKAAAGAEEEHPIKVHVHKEARDWTPVSVRAGGEPGDVTMFSWRVKTYKEKGKKRISARTSPARVLARLEPSGGDKELVISIFPKALAAQRVHVELRLLLVEGYLEKARVVAVTASGGGPYDDARMLELQGLAFQEESPGAAQVRLTAVDPRPGRESFNAGKIVDAEFPELHPDGLPDLGNVRLEYSARGVTGPASGARRPRAGTDRGGRKGSRGRAGAGRPRGSGSRTAGRD